MTSTVLDVGLCLLLVSAAAVTVSSAPQPAVGADEAAHAANVANTLATSTASISYTLAPGARYADETLVAFPATTSPEFNRTSHGSLAGLVADAAVGNLSIDGRQPTRTTDGFERAVEQSVIAALPGNVQIIAIWHLYPGSPIGGRIAIGAPPPPRRTVHAATLTLPSGYPAAESAARRAAQRDGFAGVARVVATRFVAGTFPPSQTQLALGDDYPVAALVTYRYRRIAQFTGTSVAPALADSDVATANDRLVTALTPRIERDLRAEFASPAEAAAAVDLAHVRLVVRTWS